MDVTLVAPDIRYSCGIWRYTESIERELRKLGLNVERRVIRKIEKEIMGKKFGGLVSLMLLSMLTRPNTRIVHSTSVWTVTTGTNVVTLHDLIPLKYPDVYMAEFGVKLIYKFYFTLTKHVDTIIVPSKAVAKDVEQILDIDRDRIYVTYEGVDFDRFYPDPRPPEGMDTEKINLVMVGEMDPRKKYEIVFEAVSQLDDNVVAHHIGSVGAWKKRSKELLGWQRKYPDKIKIHGRVSDEELRRWLSNADFFVFPSIDEGFGLPLIESMACGTNVILTDIPVFREIAGDMAAAYFKPDPEDFIRALERAQKNKKKREDLVKYARQFTWEKTAKETLEIYKKVIE